MVGALIWLPPGVGATSVLQLLGIALLLTASLWAWRILRDEVAPANVAPVAFRAGVGLSVGLMVIIGSLIAEQADVATLALAVVLGIGLVLYGLSVVAAALVRRQPGTAFPVAALVLASAVIVVGALLVVRADAGIEAITSVFAWLGVLMIVAGAALIVWGLFLRSRERREPTD